MSFATVHWPLLQSLWVRVTDPELSGAGHPLRPKADVEMRLCPALPEAFIRNFSAPYSLLQRHLVGDEDSKPPLPPLPRPLVTELTTTSFLPHVMDAQKVGKSVPPGGGRHS